MTATIVEQDVDTDSIELLDFEPAVPCDVSADGIPCPNEAEWKLTLSCCGRILLFCDDHFQQLLEEIGSGTMVFYDSKDTGGCGEEAMVQPIAAAERLTRRGIV